MEQVRQKTCPLLSLQPGLSFFPLSPIIIANNAFWSDPQLGVFGEHWCNYRICHQVKMENPVFLMEPCSNQERAWKLVKNNDLLSGRLMRVNWSWGIVACEWVVCCRSQSPTPNWPDGSVLVIPWPWWSFSQWGGGGGEGLGGNSDRHIVAMVAVNSHHFQIK